MSGKLEKNNLVVGVPTQVRGITLSRPAKGSKATPKREHGEGIGICARKI